jgi:nitrous oxide reductase accessory protein NosL
MSEQRPNQHELEEPELYVEPARMRTKDTVGVVLALLALALIGIGGYIWLNPALGIENLLGSRSKLAEPVTTAAGKEERERCPHCGMYADGSASHVKAAWEGEVEHSFDSWDCVFAWGKENKLALTGALVIAYSDTAGEQPGWLPADDAVFLYDTTAAVAGSMPPYVAAFAGEQDALRGQETLGGTVLNFPELRARWGFTAYRPVAHEGTGAASDMQEMDGAPRLEAALAAATAECPYCGMDAAKSMSHAVIQWDNGEISHHDSWDCVFRYEEQEGRMLDVARVLAHPGDKPQWLGATEAVFLYDTRSIEGSMPPYAAAFFTEQDAAATQPELGGEIVDFGQLRAKWDSRQD